MKGGYTNSKNSLVPVSRISVITYRSQLESLMKDKNTKHISQQIMKINWSSLKRT